ncbi:sulfite exporter TauE/SafE family protein [Trichlorobacter ammonificans]|uniref:Heavy-metal-associated domain (N-terminus) and membrane-bounded cytochrome biogenesis cycZ-like domain, membrane copper tolerance protein n=1 Tax=Trichlorobacter ammonificans TaxID=2916410 RepID=A0ABM9D937_9BACT|nr:sulfite exporter TauE/SafE family protein [Trichlorobacter ammonificans]CAH2031752.1 putative Heavy-metal-associated domain (N-terminus) and membrane-bounded cytochrome biogenesis cycZ-like domain, membrane copper tolerance protein [Trichlorobacter ammonificans]
MTEIWLAFLAGLAGSFHCIGMCGGIVAALSMAASSGSSRSRALSLLMYNIGRITTYTLLGVAAGLIGASLSLPAMRAVGVWLGLAANLMVITIGLASAFGFSWGLNSLESGSARFFAGPLRRAVSGDSSLAFLPVGLLLGFLPCGMIYGPLAVAASNGSPLRGGVMMLALGLGTVPILMVFGSATGAISAVFRSVMFRLLGVLIAAIGLMGLLRVLKRMGMIYGFNLW